MPSIHGSSSAVLHIVHRGVLRLCGDPRGVDHAHLRGKRDESADLGDASRRFRRPLRPPLRDRMEDTDLLGAAGPVPSTRIPHEQRAGRGLPGAPRLDDTVHGCEHRENRRTFLGGIYLRPKTVVRDRPPRGPRHAEAACPRGRADPRAGPPARVPSSAPGRFRPVGGGPSPDDLRRGREAAVGRRPHPRHHRPEAIGRRVAPHPVHRRPGKRIHLLDGPGRPPHLRQRPNVRDARLFAGRAPFHEDPGDQPGVPPRAVAVPLGRFTQPANLLGRIDASREGRASHPRGAHGELHRVRRKGVQLRLRPRHHRAQTERRVDPAGTGFLESGPR